MFSKLKIFLLSSPFGPPPVESLATALLRISCYVQTQTEAKWTQQRDISGWPIQPSERSTRALVGARERYAPSHIRKHSFGVIFGLIESVSNRHNTNSFMNYTYLQYYNHSTRQRGLRLNRQYSYVRVWNVHPNKTVKSHRAERRTLQWPFVRIVNSVLTQYDYRYITSTIGSVEKGGLATPRSLFVP